MEYEPTIAFALAAALFGLCIGSFLNVVIVRRGHVDWEQRTSIGGRSACPRCGHEIRWYENLPLISWLALRGCCRSCKLPISWRYPLVELGTALLWGAVAYTAEGIPELVTGAVLVSVLVPVAVIDQRLKIIPDEINYAVIWLGFACSLGFGPQPRFAVDGEWWWVEVLLASLLAGGFLWIPARLSAGRGMGVGDVKLMFGLGAFLGAPVAAGVMAGFLLALIPAIVVLGRRGIRSGRKVALAFGPYLSAGGVIGWFFGPELLESYVRLMTGG